MLIRRRHSRSGWTLPGGFVEHRVTVEAAAVREAEEETVLAVEFVEPLHLDSQPTCAPRRDNIGPVFMGSGRRTPQAGDDPEGVEVVSEEALRSPLAFHHAEVLAYCFRYRRTGLQPALVQP